MGTGWSLVVSFAPRTLFPHAKSPLNVTYWIGGWVGLNGSGRCGEENSLDPTGTRTPTPQSLYRLTPCLLVGPLLVTQGVSSSSCYLPHVSFFLGSLFNLEDRGDIFLETFEKLSTDYTTLYHRRHNFS
jgi:hypothetical protein